MNTMYSLLFSYILAILAGLVLIIATRFGSTDSGRRNFADVTLNGGSAIFLASADSRTQTHSERERTRKAMIIDTDFVLSSEAEVAGDLIVKGNLTIGGSARLHGSAKAAGWIILGPRALVVGNVVSDSNIFIGPGAEVDGVIHAKDDIRLMPSSNVSLSVVSGRRVYVLEGARVGKQIFARGGVTYAHAGDASRSPARTASPFEPQFSDSPCQKCRSILLTLDPIKQQWRCMKCGSYNEAPNGFSSDFVSSE
jgi:cytoskeletal protein CcmA (bactofilin family)